MAVSHLKRQASWLLALLISLALVQTAWAQAGSEEDPDEDVITGFGEDDIEEDEERAERIVITGSRVSRTDAEPVAPVFRWTREDFDSTGFSTVGDALRSLPFNSGQALVPTDSGTSFTTGLSSVNLRGLGNNNTLVLINGRRVAPSGTPGFDGFQIIPDLNTLPVAAIESIEIVKDGASALYGSDAVAGVINFNFVDDYEGVSTTFSFGNDTEHGGTTEEKSFTAVLGTSSDKMSIVMTFDWYEQEGATGNEYGLSANNQLRFGPNATDGRSSAPFPANVYAIDVDASGNLEFDPITFVDNPDFDPATAQLPNGSAYYSFTEPTANPTLDSPLLSGFRRYDFLEQSTFIADRRTYGFFTDVDYQFTDTLSGFMEFSFRRLEFEIDSAPTPLFNFNNNGDAPDGSVQIPATNPFNPFMQDLFVDSRWRIVEAGPRRNSVRGDAPRLVLGFDKEIGFDWDVTGYLLFNQYENTSVNGNTVFDSLLQDALNGVEIDGETLYANPFGPTDPRLIEYFTNNNPNVGTFELRSYNLEATGSLADLPGGTLGIAVGGEFRQEEFSLERTAANATGDVVGGSEGVSSGGDRDVLSLYAELGVPILENLEAQLAIRFEDYSDFGQTTKPKIGLKYTPTDSIVLRAGYSESFRAPDLAYLYTSSQVSFSSSQLEDPFRTFDTQPEQIRQLGGGNPDLQPEETETYYVGVLFVPDEDFLGGALEGLEIGLDLFRFDSVDIIDSFSALQILNLAFDEYETTGSTTGLFQDLIERRDPEPSAVPPIDGRTDTFGQIEFIRTAFNNLGNRKYDGLDFSVSWRREFEGIGTLGAALDLTYIHEFELGDAATPASDIAGNWLTPDLRGTVRLTWQNDDWTVNLYGSYVGEMDNRTASQQDVWGGIEDYWRFNPQVAYTGIDDWTFTVGIRNVFDSTFPYDPSSGSSGGALVGVHNVESRFIYVRVGTDW